MGFVTRTPTMIAASVTITITASRPMILAMRAPLLGGAFPRRDSTDACARRSVPPRRPRAVGAGVGSLSRSVMLAFAPSLWSHFVMQARCLPLYGADQEVK